MAAILYQNSVGVAKSAERKRNEGSHGYGDLCYNTTAMTIREIAESEEFRSVVNDYRDTCLWFANDVDHPSDRLQLEQILSSIEANGDAAAFRRVGRIRQWL